MKFVFYPPDNIDDRFKTCCSYESLPGALALEKNNNIALMETGHLFVAKRKIRFILTFLTQNLFHISEALMKFAIRSNHLLCLKGRKMVYLKSHRSPEAELGNY